MTVALEVHDLTVAYHRRPVLWNIDFSLPVGSLTAVVGPNGAGKSTLLKAALGLIPSLGGRVLAFDQPLARQRRRIGYVPQRSSVDWDFPVNVFDVALMGTYGRLNWCQRPGANERATASAALARVGLADLADRQIGQLSGGQQQRVFLARALAQQADLYFMDEPMAGVDAATEQMVFAVLEELRAAGKTIVVVHHDLTGVAKYFDHVVLLNLRLVACGPVAEVFTRENLRRAYGARLEALEAVGEALETPHAQP